MALRLHLLLICVCLWVNAYSKQVCAQVSLPQYLSSQNNLKSSPELKNYYPTLSGSVGSTRVGSLFMALPLTSHAAFAFHVANCNLAPCTFAQSKGRKAYTTFSQGNPESIFTSFIGYEWDLTVAGTVVPPYLLPVYAPKTGTHTGANCFFFCNRYTVLPNAIHNISFITKFMENFGPQDPLKIGSLEHRRAIRLLAAVLNLQPMGSLNRKNTVLHRYLMQPESLSTILRSGSWSLFKKHVNSTSGDASLYIQQSPIILDIVTEELRRYHCKVTLSAKDPDYQKLNCETL